MGSGREPHARAWGSWSLRIIVGRDELAHSQRRLLVTAASTTIQRRVGPRDRQRTQRVRGVLLPPVMKIAPFALFLLACTTTEAPLDPDRGAAATDGKEDGVFAAGSCEGACGGKSEGSCYCDDNCATYHDCCQDAAPVCGVESNRLEDRTAGLAPLASAEVFATLPYPPGNIATHANRVFISFFPDSNKGDFEVAELVDGKPVAFPADLAFQEGLTTVLGIRTDNQGRLWLLDHGLVGVVTPRLIAIDIASGDVVLDHAFAFAHAGLGSLLNDLVISPDGQWLYISDVSPIAKTPAILVVDLRSGTPVVRRRLQGHASVVHGPYDTFVHDREFKVKGFRPTWGVDGIALSGDQLYYASLNGGELWRVPAAELRGSGTPRPVKVADITQTDGMIADAQGRIYVTDMESSTVARVDPETGALEVVARDRRMRWPDGFAWHADGSLLVTASALHTFMPRLFVTSSHIASNAPYHVFRIRL